jgi:hypothetical protein
MNEQINDMIMYSVDSILSTQLSYSHGKAPFGSRTSSHVERLSLKRCLAPLSFVADWDELVDISRPPKLALSTAQPKARETTTSRIYHNAKMPYHPQTMQTPFGIPNPLPNLVCCHNSHITAA